MRNSDSSSPPSLAFALLTFVAVSTLPRKTVASPVPVPVQPKRPPFFLDFLYPSWYTPHTLSPASAEGGRKERVKPSRSAATPGSSRPTAAAAAAAGVRDTSHERPQQPRQQQKQQRRRLVTPTPQPRAPLPLAKRTTASGRPVPVKYESDDLAGGWIIDDTWDLHGHHRRGDPNAPNTSPDTLPVQNLDTTGNPISNSSSDPYIIINTDNNTLDLPFGWQEGGLNPRHESYDPVIVAVFAVILVLSIVATIGLCRWRARKLRRLRDLERLEREKTGGEEDLDSSSVDGSSESGGSREEKEKSGRRKRLSGSSSAIRKRFARFRRRHRARRNAEEKTSDGEDESRPNHQVHDDADDERTRHEHSSTASIATTLSRSSMSHRSRSSATLDDPPSNDASIPIPMDLDPPVLPGQNQISIGSSTERGRGRRERPRITITNSEVTPMPNTNTTPLLNLNMDTPNAEPPAYPTASSTANTTPAPATSTRRIRRTRTPLETSQIPIPIVVSEKAPIPGLEAEYDERDLTAYTPASLFNLRLSASGTGLSARSSAPPTRRPSRVRFADDAGEGGAGGENPHGAPPEEGEEEEQVPSFEPFASSPGTSLGVSRVAAGANLRGHVATDDKGLLERLISVSSEPPLPPPAPTLGGVSGVHAHPDELAPPRAAIPAAPSFSEIDQWELERQMAQAHAHGNASTTTLANLTTASASDPDPASSFILRTTPSTSLAGASAFGSSSRRPGASSNGFPALPAPPLPVFSTGGASGSGDVGYGLGMVWNSLNIGAGAGVGVPSMPPGSSARSASTNGKARFPSAPPLDTPALRPSAPMLDEDEDTGVNGQVMPSAPPAWDEDEDEADEPILPLGTSSLEVHAPDAPSADESSVVHQPNALSVPDNEGDAGSDGDGDGAESIISTPPDNEEPNSRWSATFRTRAEEGAGLPRYEP